MVTPMSNPAPTQTQEVTMNTSPLAIRVERRIPGSPSNYGHDVTVFGFFTEGRFFTAQGNRAVSIVMEHGLGVHRAQELLAEVEETDGAVEVTDGEIEVL